jgi:hypothetical protein
VPFSAFGVAAGVADEDESVPGDRRARDELAPVRVDDRRLPDALAGLEVIGQDPPVLAPRNSIPSR